jgi:hypothetical protein
MRVSTSGWLIGLGLCAVAVAGCSAASATDLSVTGAPDRVIPIAGTNLNRIVLAPQAVGHLGIVTTPVRTLPTGTATIVPVSAVLYLQDGSTWVYTNPAPNTYVRQAVVLGPVDNDQWELTSGPTPGTAVVTVGGAELLGAEQGVEGE